MPGLLAVFVFAVEFLSLHLTVTQTRTIPIRYHLTVSGEKRCRMT